MEFYMSRVYARDFLVGCCPKPFKIHVADAQLPLPLGALFDDVEHSKHLVRATSSFSKICLLLSESLFYCFKDLPYDELC